MNGVDQKPLDGISMAYTFANPSDTIAGKGPLPDGKVTLRYEVVHDSNGLGKGGTARLFVNDKLVAEGRIESTVPVRFTADELLDVGLDTSTPSADIYSGVFPCPGRIQKVKNQLK
jgi:hypothetical protein